MSKILKDENGFSLASVMVAAGLLGVVAIGVVQVMKNINQSSNMAQSVSDEILLRNTIQMVLSDENHCRLSFAGDGELGTPDDPVVFEKRDIDEDNEGLNIALYLSNQAADERGLKKFNGENFPDGDDKSKFGKLRIESMKLIMNNGVGTNYTTSTLHSDIGVLRVQFNKKVSSSRTVTKKLDFDVKVGMSTNSSGQSTIISCSSAVSSASGGGCTPESSWICSCSADTTSSHEGRVYGCIHCNEDGVVDDYWMGGFHATGGNSDCPSGVNPPGSDPVSKYSISRNN